MVKMAEEYNKEHGLEFSTDPKPGKSKTKCIAWTTKPRNLPDIKLNGDILPWVDKIDHLGVTITNDKDILEKDMIIKKAKYISKNNEINQEFFFVDYRVKIKINEVYNNIWYGSNLYDLVGPEAIKLEAAYNKSVKIMLDLPYGTHRGLIEPLTGRKHLRKILWKRFLTMMKSIVKSKKSILRVIYNEIWSDTRSRTGRNLRRIMLESGSNVVDHDQDMDVIRYHDMDKDEEWRIEYIRFLLDQKSERDLDEEEEEWLNYLCND